MNIIELYESLKGSYKSYLQSFVAIKDERIKDEVSESIKNEKLWRKALIQFNPMTTIIGDRRKGAYRQGPPYP